jgi:hypothetical protein
LDAQRFTIALLCPASIHRSIDLLLAPGNHDDDEDDDDDDDDYDQLPRTQLGLACRI